MLEKYLPKSQFSSYAEFSRDYKINVPDRFNFAWDVVDDIAAREPRRSALVWCDEKGAEASFTFGQMAELSNRAATFLL